MKMRVTIIVSILLICMFGLAYSQVQVPHTFQAGQPARASEVNDNFSALAADINAVAAAATPMAFRFVGFSSGAITPDQGIYAMGALCRADYGPNARLARVHEIFDLTSIPLGSSQQGAWIEAAPEGAFSSSGTNCDAWSTIQSSPNTSPMTTIVDDQGRVFDRVVCAGSRPVACSVLQ